MTGKDLQRHRGTMALLLLLTCAVSATLWFRLNVSSSAPYGLYRLAAVPTPLRRGTWVVLPVPSSVQAWHSPWEPLLKPVAGVAGDTVCQINQRLTVNGVDYGPVYPEAHGRVLPQMEAGCHVVAEDTVFLASPAPRSLDGRYMGPTPITALMVQAIPVLTWR